MLKCLGSVFFCLFFLGSQKVYKNLDIDLSASILVIGFQI